jgi:hypothetical protein
LKLIEQAENLSPGNAKFLRAFAKNLGKAGRSGGAVVAVLLEIVWPDTIYAAEADWPQPIPAC